MPFSSCAVIYDLDVKFSTVCLPSMPLRLLYPLASHSPSFPLYFHSSLIPLPFRYLHFLISVGARFPFLMYNNPTTKSGNISEVPIFALDLAQGAYDSAMAAGEKKGLQSPPQKTMNSCHAQLYPVGGCMAPHKDTGGSWGLSISLGASALFRVDQLVLRLNSGDVVIANFGGRVHSVRLRSPKTAPEWWTNSRFTYGAARCNVQFRCAGDYTGPKEVHIPWSRTAVWLHKLARFLR
ncbi:hypothetical protein AAMO2058_000690800 [Amorphochlora amoebiformis]